MSYRVSFLGGLFAWAAMYSSALAAEPAPTNYCEYFAKIQAYARSLNAQIDQSTRLSNVELDCAKKLILYRQDIALNNSVIREGWEVRRANAWSKHYCVEGTDFSRAMKDGWTIATIFATADGREVSIKASCENIVATIPSS